MCTRTGEEKLSINSPILALSLALPDPTINQPVKLSFAHITVSVQLTNTVPSSGHAGTHHQPAHSVYFFVTSL